jgi:hypothetical protein
MRRNSESGFSLLELVVAVLLTVGLIGMVMTLANKNQQVFVTEVGVVDMNQNMRTAIDLMTRDIQSAGMGLPVAAKGNFASIFYTDGKDGAPDSIMMINGDPFAPLADLAGRAAGSAEFFLFPPAVTGTGNGANERFTYSYIDANGNTQTKPIYRTYEEDPKTYIVYDEEQAMIFNLTQNGQMTGNGNGARLKIQHNPQGFLNPPSVFGTTIGTGEPDYDSGKTKVAVLGNTVGYRLNRQTRELERTEDMITWYPIARGIVDMQIRYRVVLRNTVTNLIEEKVSDTPGNGVDSTESGFKTSRRDIHSVIIRITAETPDADPNSRFYRRVTQIFEVAPRNLNLVRNNNLSAGEDAEAGEDQDEDEDEDGNNDT